MERDIGTVWNPTLRRIQIMFFPTVYAPTAVKTYMEMKPGLLKGKKNNSMAIYHFSAYCK